VTRIEAKTSIADGISVKQIGYRNFEIIRDQVDDIVLVDEEQIAAAVLMLLERKKVLAEGSGAVPLAALMSGKISIPPDAGVVLVISGGNVDNSLLGRIISKGLLNNGRILRLWIPLEDASGSLARLLTLVASLNANVLHVYHDRNVRRLPLNITYVELELETRGAAHCENITRSIRDAGYDIQHKE
jgi:threonine dehydratase